MMFARCPRTMLESNNDLSGFDAHEWNRFAQNKLQNITSIARNTITRAQELQKRSHDKAATKDNLQTGDEVWVRQISRGHKLAPLWKRGWFIKKVLSNQNVVIHNPYGVERVLHREKLRRVGGQEETTVNLQEYITVQL